MNLKRFYIGFTLFYLIYAIIISLYLFSIEPGYVPDSYKGTVADPTTFMTMEQIYGSSSFRPYLLFHVLFTDTIGFSDHDSTHGLF